MNIPRVDRLKERPRLGQPQRSTVSTKLASGQTAADLIKTIPVSATAPTEGQILTARQNTAVWETPAGTSPGTGGSFAHGIINASGDTHSVLYDAIGNTRIDMTNADTTRIYGGQSASSGRIVLESSLRIGTTGVTAGWLRDSDDSIFSQAETGVGANAARFWWFSKMRSWANGYAWGQGSVSDPAQLQILPTTAGSESDATISIRPDITNIGLGIYTASEAAQPARGLYAAQRWELGPGGGAARDLKFSRTGATLGKLEGELTIENETGTFESGAIAGEANPRTQVRFDGFWNGPGGGTAPDTGWKRQANAGRFVITSYLELPHRTTKPTTTGAGSLGIQRPIFLYARGETGAQSRLFMKYDANTGNKEFGPIGLLEGVLRYFNFPFGGFSIISPNGLQTGAGIAAMANFWGALPTPSIIGTASTADAAYSPALSLGAAMDATQTAITISGGTPNVEDILVIDSERMIYQGGAPNVIRGVQGTTPAAHLNGATILRWGVTSGTQTRYGWDGGACIEQDTGATSGTDAGLEWPTFFNIHDTPMLLYQFHQDSITNQRLFIGFTNQTLATMNASDNPAGHYAGLQFSTARGDTQFQYVTKDGTTQNVTSSGVAPVAPSTGGAGPHWYVRIERVSGAMRFVLFDEAYAEFGNVTVTANLPSDYIFQRLVAGVRNTAAESKRIQHRYCSFMTRPSAF